MKIFHKNRSENKKEKIPVQEAYRTLRTNIQFCKASKEIKSLVITSSCPNEGKSTTAYNLANSFSQSGSKVLIIDCDLRKPTIHKLFGVTNGKGLTNLLANQINVNEVINKSSSIGVDYITAGVIPPNPSELLNSKIMEFYLKTFREAYDYIIMDTPPVTLVTDAQILAGKSDGTLLVVASRQVNKKSILEGKNLLEKVGANILGAILTKVKLEKNQYEKYYQYSNNLKIEN